MTTATAPVARLLDRLERVRARGNGWMACCPAHPDRTPSLSISIGDDGRALAFCHAGCSFDEIAAAVGLGVTELFADDGRQRPYARRWSSTRVGHLSTATRLARRGRAPDAPASDDDTDGGTPTGLTLEEYAAYFHLPVDFLRLAGLADTTYSGRPAVAIPYRDEDGDVAATRYRLALTGDRFRWAWDDTTTLYGLPDLPAAREAGWVVLVEGESDVHALRFHDVPALGIPGTSTWRDEWAAHFDGIGQIYVVDEQDDAAAKLLAKLAASPIAERVQVVTMPEPHGDVADLHRADPDGFRAALEDAIADAIPLPAYIVKTSKPSEGVEMPSRTNVETVKSPLSTVSTFCRYTLEPPNLDETAYHGLAGEVVRTIEPHTEADPAALLLSFLTYFGNLVGRGPHLLVDGARHDGRLFVLMVGSTSRSRKGTSEKQVRRLLEPVDPDWPKRIMGGLGSGEGLVYHVRDRVVDEKGEVTDAGVEDKRLMISESEFASILRKMARRGSTISAQLRQAWDGDRLQILNKNSPVTATGAHVSVLAHITERELRHELTETESANGFANRFLIHLVHRAQLLPMGGEMHRVNVGPLVRRIRGAVEFARGVQRLHWDESGRSLWCGVYPEVTSDISGLVGALTARVEAHAIRLAVLYVLLDGSDRIEARHLKPALAIIDHAVGSVRHIFRDATGNALANRILERVQDKGELGRDELNRSLGGHVDSGLIDDALGLLEELGHVAVEYRPTGGRPAQVIILRQNVENVERAGA